MKWRDIEDVESNIKAARRTNCGINVKDEIEYNLGQKEIYGAPLY